MDPVLQGRDAKGKTVKAGDHVRWWSTPNLYHGHGKIKSIEFRPAGIDKSDPEAWRYSIVTASKLTIHRWDEEILKA